jgi:hypothetical protein
VHIYNERDFFSSFAAILFPPTLSILLHNYVIPPNLEQNFHAEHIPALFLDRHPSLCEVLLCKVFA